MEIKNQKPVIIDVRSPAEFKNGQVDGSINIPLQDIPLQLETIKTMDQPILLCCASGNRSGQAAAYLKKHGVACENGGSWMEVNQLIHQE
jgi:rhodanese-related sulfurtransferase